ncbi:dimethylallyladenosine tRNA methylthiotransferase [Sorangium cellulosum]|uniref:tRNA-2-methylthio-N(6)-dimethylallyladenosine synthase n=1 Tax=Sorangium cellulosum TaxID=56 RepID=A0A2L0F0F4_SORCE|nr:tRNA (N6-isopentenyl adenosine(37)-C2)-methylthiotransferase MiaB [Sorangium cellulosum]AUX45048.1 dimethylallyladenosine tRNA methylthiotransferase [Sorangium cellulosum]
MPRYAITTFGCQMNVHDSERMHDVLRRAGYTEAGGPDEADVLVLNTCSVREKAEQKLRSEVGRLARWKRERGDRVLVVAGCVAQQEGERLLKQMRAIDVVVGPDNIPELPGLLGDLALGGLPVARTVFDVDAPRFLMASPTPGAGAQGGAPAAFVTIMKGCDERCSFCIVPYTRGPERYRPSDEIVAEIAALVAAGVREITLLGQTVNSYRDPLGALPRAPGASADDPDESEFAALLRRIAERVPGLARLRYTSPHPRHLTPSLIRAHAELAVLPRHVHLPVQSGSDRILRRMIRRYTRAEYVARTRALVEAVPGLTLSTDIIVGFPGETEDDFAATLSLVREVGYKGLFGFKYSRRPHTPALKLPDDVSEDVKGERLARLFEASEALLAAHLEGLVGTTQEVLVEGRDKQRGAGGTLWSGRTGRHEIVHIEGAGELDLLGEVVEVAIARANKHSLQAELTEAARAAARPRQRVGAGDAAGAEAARPARRVLPVIAAEGG